MTSSWSVEVMGTAGHWCGRSYPLPTYAAACAQAVRVETETGRRTRVVPVGPSARVRRVNRRRLIAMLAERRGA